MSDADKNNVIGSGSLNTGRERNASRNASLAGVLPNPCSTSCTIGPQVTKFKSCSSETLAFNLPFSNSTQTEVSTRIIGDFDVSVVYVPPAYPHASARGSPSKCHCQRTLGAVEFA